MNDIRANLFIGGALPTGGVSPAEFAAQVDALAAADTALASEVRNGRVWGPNGSQLTPSGLTPPASTDMIITKSSVSNVFRVWRVESNVPEGTSESNTLAKDATGVWWARVRDYDLTQLETIMRDGFRDLGTIGTTNIGGTGDAITADIAANALATGFTVLSGSSEIEYIPVATNGAANPTMTIGGSSYGIRGADGAAWPARSFKVGRSYKLRRRGSVLRVVQGDIIGSDYTQYTLPGSTISPSAASSIPVWASILICRSSVSNTFSMWRRETTASPEAETERLAKDADGVWWVRLDEYSSSLLKEAAQDSAGKIFQSRASAVAYGQANLPARMYYLITVEDGEFTVRFHTSTTDALFDTYPQWGIRFRVPAFTGTNGFVEKVYSPDFSTRSFSRMGRIAMVCNPNGIEIWDRFDSTKPTSVPGQQDASGVWWGRRWTSRDPLEAVSALEARQNLKISALNQRIQEVADNAGSGSADEERERAMAAEADLAAQIVGVASDTDRAVSSLDGRITALDASSIPGIKGPFATDEDALGAIIDGEYAVIADTDDNSIWLKLREDSAMRSVAPWGVQRSKSLDRKTSAILTGGDWSGNEWTSSVVNDVQSQIPDALLPHTQDVTGGAVLLPANVALWSKQVVDRDFRCGLKATITFKLEGASPAGERIEFVARGFSAFSGETITLSRNAFYGDGVHSFTATMPADRWVNTSMARVGVKAHSGNSAGATLRVMQMSVREFDVNTEYSIYDFNPDMTPGADNSDAIQRGLDAMPSGLGQSIRFFDLGSRNWNVGKTIYTNRNCVGIANGELTAIGSAQDWITTDYADNAELRFLHDEVYGWPDQTTVQAAIFTPKSGWRLGVENVRFNCNHICGAICDVKSASMRLINIAVCEFGVYGTTYINNAGMRIRDSFYFKFDDTVDPRWSKHSLNTGVGIFSTKNDGAFTNVGGHGGYCGWYQYKGGTIAVHGFHWWQQPATDWILPAGTVIKAGETFQIDRFWVDSVNHVRLGSMTATPGDNDQFAVSLTVDGAIVLTALKDWDGSRAYAIWLVISPLHYNAILRGWGSTWRNCYIDTGKLQLWGSGHEFKDCYGLAGQPVLEDCQFELVPTAVNQTLSETALNIAITNRYRVPIWTKLLKNPGNSAYNFKVREEYLYRSNIVFTDQEGELLHGEGENVQVYVSTASKATTRYNAADGNNVDVGSDAGDFVVNDGSGEDMFRVHRSSGAVVKSLKHYDSDAAAAADGVPINGWYRTAGSLKIRLS